MFIHSYDIEQFSNDKDIDKAYAFDQGLEKILELKKDFSLKNIFGTDNIITITKFILEDFGMKNIANFTFNHENSFIKNCLFSYYKKDYNENNINVVIHELAHFFSLKLFNSHNSIYHDHLFFSIMSYLYKIYDILEDKDISLAYLLSGEEIKILNYNDFLIEELDFKYKDNIINDFKLEKETFIFHKNFERFLGKDDKSSFCFLINNKQKKCFFTKRNLFKFEVNTW